MMDGGLGKIHAINTGFLIDNPKSIIKQHAIKYTPTAIP